MVGVGTPLLSEAIAVYEVLIAELVKVVDLVVVVEVVEEWLVNVVDGVVVEVVVEDVVSVELAEDRISDENE